MMVNILIFVLFQGLAINGVQLSMDDGMILERYKKWLKKRKYWMGKMGGLCIKCSASIGGTITFWPAAIYAFGFRPIEFLEWAFDIFVLVSVNWIIYKKM